MGQHWQELIPIDRYVVVANGLLHEFDRKVLTFLYQPLVGSACFSLYMTLWTELEDNTLWSESSSHHLLMNLMEMNLKDIYNARLKLEGIGLLKSFVKTEESGRSFIYELQPPLTPEQFFLDGMLNIYLYRKIGKNHFARLKRFFSIQKKPPEIEYNEVTKSFQDVYESISPGSLQYLQGVADELEVEANKAFFGRVEQKEIQIDTTRFDFDLLLAGLNESLVPKKAINKKVKEAISNLAFLYTIDAIQMKSIILGALDEDSEINIEELRKSARDWYQFIHEDKLPSLIERTQPTLHQVQQDKPKTKEEKLIRYLETTSPLQVLKDLSGGAEPSKSDIQIIEEVMFKQKLLPGVINVLIQFVMLRTDMKLTKSYVEKIAGHWTRKQIKTVKEAMDLAINEHRTYLEWSNGKKSGRSSKQKPIRTEFLPDWFDEDPKKALTTSPKENNNDLEAKKREIEDKLKAFRK
ncbi:replication initiation and membrane attachment family protein [Neobacillus sp. PS3-40]|jgi:replication initiation and membrane attachment protein|uniref:replication initiation and membrane attachment family protein n=1 Tax=Neobacillus sp. PS3-40 TaxID=3070679 RepID=UPI0027E04BEE|nr:replication initiation and membrane attachment family protein [Neobacillus sp. PS3-40]WML45618.1 replication initiation and membrane attachment family protein [Neobacillus sp. PS3-40]